MDIIDAGRSAERNISVTARIQFACARICVFSVMFGVFFPFGLLLRVRPDDSSTIAPTAN